MASSEDNCKISPYGLENSAIVYIINPRRQKSCNLREGEITSIKCPTLNIFPGKVADGGRLYQLRITIKYT